VRDDRDYGTGPPWLAAASPSYFAAYVEANRQVPTDSLSTLADRALAQALTTDLTDAAIDRAKRELKMFLDRWLMGSDLLHLGDHLAAFALFDGRATRLNSLAREIDAVTPAQVRRLAARYRRTGAARITVVVPAPAP
jgi:predicted Zn-dependent peptidase